MLTEFKQQTLPAATAVACYVVSLYVPDPAHLADALIAATVAGATVRVDSSGASIGGGSCCAGWLRERRFAATLLGATVRVDIG